MATTATVTIESDRGVSVVKDTGIDGRIIYRVLRNGEALVPVSSMQEAIALARTVRPRKVTCSRCGEMDVESFPMRLGLGCLRIHGLNGWSMERLFGGNRSDHEDVVLCPACVKKEVAP